MCKYCNDLNYYEIKDTSVKDYKMQSAKPKCFLEIHSNKEINYCPMCGKKLKLDDNSKPFKKTFRKTYEDIYNCGRFTGQQDMFEYMIKRLEKNFKKEMNELIYEYHMWEEKKDIELNSWKDKE